MAARKTLTAILVILFLPALSLATTYHVCTNGSAVNDGKSIGQAWTLKKAADTATGNDTVLIHGPESCGTGAYSSTIGSPLFPLNSGTSAALPLTFQVATGETVTIRGGSKIASGSSWTDVGGGIYSIAFTSSYMGSHYTAHVLDSFSGFVNIDEGMTSTSWLKPAESLALMAAGTWWWDANVLYVWMADSGDPGEHDVYAPINYANATGVYLNNKNYIKLVGLTTYLTSFGFDLEGTSSYNSLEDCEGYNSHSPFFSVLTGTGNSCTDCIAHDVWSGPAFQWSSVNSPLVRPIAYNTGITSWATVYNSGIIVNGSGVAITSPTIYALGVTATNGAPGIQFETTSPDDTCHDNTVTGGTIDGANPMAIYYYGSNNVTVSGMTITRTTGSVAYVGPGTALLVDPTKRSASGNIFTGNTISECTDYALYLADATYSLNTTFNSNNVKNCKALYFKTGLAAAELTADYNNYKYASSYFQYGATLYNSLAAYVAATDKDAHSKQVEASDVYENSTWLVK